MTDYARQRTMMVDTQVRPSDVTKFPIIDAMLRVRREIFVPADMTEVAYVSENVLIGEQRMLLEPRTLAKMLDALDIQPEELVLDVGAGLGYSSAVIAMLAEAVVAVEDEADLAEDAQSLLAAEGIDNVAVIHTDLGEGSPGNGPFDVIIIQGGVQEVPESLMSQLKDGGRICALFMDDGVGACRIGYASDGHVTWRFEFNASAPILAGFHRTSAFAL